MIRLNVGRRRVLFATPDEVSMLERIALDNPAALGELIFAALQRDVLFKNPTLDEKVLAVGINFHTERGLIMYEVFRYDPKDLGYHVNRDLYAIRYTDNKSLVPIRRLHPREIRDHHSDSLPERVRPVAALNYSA